MYDNYVAFCFPLDDISNGAITYSVPNAPTFDVGTEATYQCSDGYALMGVMIQECMSSLTWSGQSPTCERKSQ